MVSNSESTEVAFVGLGIMGRHMAGHVQRAGYRLHVYNRTRAKADAMVAAGAVWHDNPGEAAAQADVIITMVGYPADVEQVYLEPDGIVARARPGSYLVDMTTSEPSLAIRIAEAARARGVHALDAPVSGGDVGARDAKLSIMVGGDADAFEAVLPILRCMGTNVQLQGGPGAGQHTKMCNQIVVANNMLGAAEAVAYARRAGLDPMQVLKSIGTGAASSFSLNVLGPRMVQEDYAPGFFVHHFLKDMAIVLREAESMGLDLRGLRTAQGQYARVAERDGRMQGTQAVIRAYGDDEQR